MQKVIFELTLEHSPATEVTIVLLEFHIFATTDGTDLKEFISPRIGVLFTCSTVPLVEGRFSLVELVEIFLEIADSGLNP